MTEKQATYARKKAIEQRNINRWLAVNPFLNDKSGIYVLTREDESGIKYAYIGQSRHVLTRLAEHLTGYQHIDLSLKSHGLVSADNPYGWFASATPCDESRLDVEEQRYIKRYADMGYQLRNKTLGGQGVGKQGIDANKPSKGYYDGKKQGRRDLANEIKGVLKYLNVTPKDGKLAERMMDKFVALLDE